MCLSNSVERDRQTYLLHAKLASYRRRIVKASKIVKTALADAQKPLLSFSAGKDSIVLLDIAYKAGFRGELLFFSYGICTGVETPAENIALLKRYADKYGLQYHILRCLGEADCWQQCGRFILQPETPEERAIFRRTNYDFAKQAENFCRSNGIDLQIIGMRKAESARRRAMLNTKGAIYQTQERASKTCCPLAGLTSADIWAYIFDNGLEYLPIYDYPYIDRREIRNEITLLYNDAIIRHGIAFHYKKMYPDFFGWLRREYGDVL